MATGCLRICSAGILIECTSRLDSGILLEPIKDVVQQIRLDSYCATRAIAFQSPMWAHCTGPWAAKLYRTNMPQSFNVGTTFSKILYDKHMHGRNLVKMGPFLTAMIPRRSTQHARSAAQHELGNNTSYVTRSAVTQQ